MQNLIFLNGDEMPILGLGTWKSKSGQAYDAIREAIRLGYRHFDCAHIYDNEVEIGNAITDAIKAGSVRREELWITSKLWNDAHARQDVVPALQKTLANLQLDYLDLYLIHWPIAFKPFINSSSNQSKYADPEEFPLAETWQGMEECVTGRLAKHIGVSNFSATKIKALLRTAIIKPEMNQVELHPFLVQQALVDYCHTNHIHLTAYAPLGSKNRSADLKAADDTDLLKNNVIKDVGLRRGMTPAQVLIKWSIDRGISVIPKSVHPARLRQNIESINCTFGADDMDAIKKLDRHARFVDAGFWVHDGSPHTLKSIWDE